MAAHTVNRAQAEVSGVRGEEEEQVALHLEGDEEAPNVRVTGENRKERCRKDKLLSNVIRYK